VGQNSSYRLGHRWLLRHIQNSNRSRHLQASSPQNSQPKKNPKIKTTSNAPVSALQLLHCSGRCDSELFSIALQRKMHRPFASFAWNSRTQFTTLFGVWCCWRACFALWTFVFRTSRVLGGKEKDRLPGINIGTQSILTGLAGIIYCHF
jgi:hypothetical protein